VGGTRDGQVQLVTVACSAAKGGEADRKLTIRRAKRRRLYGAWSKPSLLSRRSAWARTEVLNENGEWAREVSAHKKRTLRVERGCRTPEKVNGAVIIKE